jgi:hypothetical protein
MDWHANIEVECQVVEHGGEEEQTGQQQIATEGDGAGGETKMTEVELSEADTNDRQHTRRGEGRKEGSQR